MKEHQITMHEPDGWMQATGGYAKDMTLRDYFASKAMSAYIGRPNLPVSIEDNELACACYEMADAMLKAREA